MIWRWLIPIGFVLGLLAFAAPVLNELRSIALGSASRAGSSSTSYPGTSVAPAKSTAVKKPAPKVITVPTEATVYRWRDKSGTLHIESSPPPEGANAEVLTLRGKKKMKVEEAEKLGIAVPERGSASNTGSLNSPASVYTRDGFNQLLDRLDKTVEKMDERRQVIDKIGKDL